MRIAVVSAHYPPNFVSGGTLVPQRLAQGLARRGHQVGVFAGWLDLQGEHPERASLDSFDETDDAGVAVRWVVTTPFIGWADRANFDNPPVVERFEAWLAELRPDVVHFHSLQSLGAGVVPAARNAGARVVVTMHDFWWCCARQFLVDRTDVPCCLVVDAGVCPCEAGHDWLADRNRRLRHDLAAAEVVLAPSHSAAAVLAANGLAADRLRVDENGLPEADLPRLTRTAAASPATAASAAQPDGDAPVDAVVRFTYAGGHNLMKGAGVLTDAARLVARRRPVGWELTAYGLGPHLVDAGTSLGRAPVTVAEPYSPGDLDAVLAATDVLVLPSVMRESHSILTREALTRGVPVITTDSLGPEEVVVAGTNGLVVPSADPEALAAAMVQVIDDRELLGRLTKGATDQPVALRALSEQVTGLEAMFTDLVASPPPPVEPGRAVNHVVFMAGIEGAPLRYRARLPAEALGLVGVTSEVFHYRDARLEAAIAGADALVVYRVPATVEVRRLLDGAHRQGIPVVFDVDDLIFDPDLADDIPALRILSPEDSELWLQGVRRYRTTMEQADGYVGSTQALVDHAATVTGLPVARFDNGVGLLLARSADTALRRPRAPGPIRIGYLSGTITHDEDWFYVEPAVIAVLDAHPEVELWMGGHLPHSEALAPYGERVRRIPFTPWTELSTVLRDLDVNLAPLAPGSLFNEAKSAIKWLEAALTATPTVASPTQPFREAIEAGVNGFLAEDRGGWFTAIDALVSDDVLRRQIGARARRDALVRWSPHLQGRRYLEILERARGWEGQAPDRRGDRPAWAPVELEEPAVDHHPLEAYTLGDQPPEPIPVPPAPTPMAKVRHLAGRVRRNLRTEGLAGTARRAGPFVARRIGRWRRRR